MGLVNIFVFPRDRIALEDNRSLDDGPDQAECATIVPRGKD